MDDACTVTFEGDYGGTYYVPCDYVVNIGSNLVNTGGSSFRGYKNITAGSASEYITFNVDQYPSYYISYSNTHYITNAHNVTFNNRAYFYREKDIVIILLLLILGLSRILSLGRHGR